MAATVLGWVAAPLSQSRAAPAAAVMVERATVSQRPSHVPTTQPYQSQRDLRSNPFQLPAVLIDFAGSHYIFTKPGKPHEAIPVHKGLVKYGESRKIEKR